MHAVAVLSAWLLFAGLARLLGAFAGAIRRGLPTFEKDENGPMFQLNFGLLGVRVLGPTVARVSIGPFQPRSYTISEGTGPMDITLGDNSYTNVHIHGLDAAKQEGSFKSPPAWTVDHPEIVKITPDAGGVNCRFEAADPIVLGIAVVTVTDVDDAGVPPLTFNVTIGGEQITTLGATVDPPQEKVPDAPAPVADPNATP